MARARKFATWTYRDDDNGRRVEVECRCTTERTAYSETTTFRVDLRPRYPITLSDTDPNRLREAVFAELAKQVEVAWSDVLRVFVGGEFSGGGQGCRQFIEEGFGYVGLAGKLVIDIDPHQVGRRDDGTSVHKRHGDGGVNAREGELYAGPATEGGYGERIAGAWAVIPDTPENRRALAAIVDGMAGLQRRLRDLLGQDQIGRTLELVRQAPGLLGLPAPPPEDTGPDGG